MPSPQLVCLKWYDARFFLFKYFPSHFFDGLLPWILFSLVPLLYWLSLQISSLDTFFNTQTEYQRYIYIYIYFSFWGGVKHWKVFVCLFPGRYRTCRSPFTNVFRLSIGLHKKISLSTLNAVTQKRRGGICYFVCFFSKYYSPHCNIIVYTRGMRYISPINKQLDTIHNECVSFEMSTQ